MRLTVAGLLMGVTPQRIDLTNLNYQSQGFVGDKCNTEVPGAGCDVFFRCAYLGTDFVVQQ